MRGAEIYLPWAPSYLVTPLTDTARVPSFLCVLLHHSSVLQSVVMYSLQWSSYASRFFTCTEKEKQGNLRIVKQLDRE